MKRDTSIAAVSRSRRRELVIRIMTAAIAVPLVVAGLLLLPSAAIAALFGLTMVLGAREWASLADLTRVSRAGLIGLTALATLVAVALLVTAPSVASAFYGVALALGLAASLTGAWLVLPPTGAYSRAAGASRAGFWFGGAVFVGAIGAVASVLSVADGGGRLLVFFVLIWLVDTAGYAAGRLIGGIRLTPTISPGKTWAGAIAGVVVVALGAAVFRLAAGESAARASFIIFALVGVWLAITSILGDLTISLLKRRANLADTGVLFPGHGGVLDRLDGLIFALPWFALADLWLWCGK